VSDSGGTEDYDRSRSPTEPTVIRSILAFYIIRMQESKSNILIIGAGTWGCSIALELARRGHTGIKVLDGSPFPSAISAGNDLNKICEEGNETHFPSCFSSSHDYLFIVYTEPTQGSAATPPQRS
jgi:hypothetical protein